MKSRTIILMRLSPITSDFHSTKWELSSVDSWKVPGWLLVSWLVVLLFKARFFRRNDKIYGKHTRQWATSILRKGQSDCIHFPHYRKSALSSIIIPTDPTHSCRGVRVLWVFVFMCMFLRSFLKRKTTQGRLSFIYHQLASFCTNLECSISHPFLDPLLLFPCACYWVNWSKFTCKALFNMRHVGRSDRPSA